VLGFKPVHELALAVGVFNVGVSWTRLLRGAVLAVVVEILVRGLIRLRLLHVLLEGLEFVVALVGLGIVEKSPASAGDTIEGKADTLEGFAQEIAAGLAFC
jgi:hypothetical protein